MWHNSFFTFDYYKKKQSNKKNNLNVLKNLLTYKFYFIKVKKSCITAKIVKKYKFLNIFFQTSILLLLFWINCGKTCSIEINTLCNCIDESDGVLLNCSKGVDGIELIQTLKLIQSQIGLIKNFVISNSKIPIIKKNFFYGLYIKRLEMKNCNIQLIEEGAFNGLESILQELSLSTNQLKEVPINALKDLISISKLDLSNNLINDLEGKHALPKLNKLFDINLSHNQIKNIHKNFFEGAKNSLQTINLGHNFIEEVPASALRGFRQLMALHIHNNYIRNLTALSFMNLPMLSLLNLALNKIHSIHKQAFLNTPSLRFLYMTENQLNHIQPFQFVSFEQLEMLDLSSNRLVVIQNNSFSNLIALKQLYLGDNQISRIDENAFTNSSIITLILEGNLLRDITKEMFQSATKLQQLSLKENKIVNIDANAFHENQALVIIDLSYNNIIDLAPATFLSQLNMLLINLSYNKLPRTPYAAFNKRVITVLLQENPLVCVEKLHMLQQGVSIYVPNSEDKVCGTYTLPIPNSNNSNPSILGNNLENFEKKISFKQLTTTDITQENNNYNVSQHLTNIRPLPKKQLTTTLINEISYNNSQNQQVSESLIRSNTDKQLKLFKPALIENSRFNYFLQFTTESNIPHHQKILFNSFGTQKPINDFDEKIEKKNNLNTISSTSLSLITHSSKQMISQNFIQNNKIHLKENLLNTTRFKQTLPPNIVVAPQQESIYDKEEELEKLNNFSTAKITTKLEEFEIKKFLNSNNDIVLNKNFPSFTTDVEDYNENRKEHFKQFPMFIILICIGTVILVTCAVFIGLCAAKKRRIHLIESSSNSIIGVNNIPNPVVTNNLLSYSTLNNKMLLKDNKNLKKKNDVYKLTPFQDDLYGWMYSPATYNFYAQK